MDIVQMLKDTLEGRVDDWSEAERETALAVGKDLAELMGKQVAGGDVDPTELAIAKAAALNLASAAVFSGAAAMMEFLERLAGKAIGLLNPLA